MTSRADQYRERAVELERRAEAVKNDRIKQTLLNLAKQWRDLERQIEDPDNDR